MSLKFSDTTAYRGIVQMYERETGQQLGDVSNNTKRLKYLTADVNLALDEFFRIGFKAGGTWQFDDANHTDFPIITTNLVAGQRDYTFTTDNTGNYILDIYKVMVADAGGTYTEIDPVDVQSQSNTSSFYDGQNTQGTPYRYDKTANGIFLDPIPNVNVTNGLKVYINREPSYFVSTDTTKVAGIPGMFHDYLYLKPAAEYARRNNLANYRELQARVIEMEGNEQAGIVGTIGEYFAGRNRDVRKRLSVSRDSNK